LLPPAGQNGPPKAWITQDADGYVVVSMLVPGVVMGQVRPGTSGKPAYALHVPHERAEEGALLVRRFSQTV
jgi:hypothetical protein